MTEAFRGIALLVASLFFFAALDATAKYLTQNLPIPAVTWARYLVHCLLMLIFLAPRMGRRLLYTTRPMRQIVRALLLLGTTVFGYGALSRMPLAETTATFFIVPLLVSLLAGPMLGEKMTPKHWIAIFAGLGGVLLIARPGGSATIEGMMFVSGAAICHAFYQILTRQLAPTENNLAMLFYTALVGTVCMSAGLPFFWGSFEINANQGLLMIGLGVFGGIGHWLLISAFRWAPASLLAPFQYLQLIWAILLGVLVFNQWPDALSITGMLIIVGSGMLLAWKTRAINAP